MTQEELLKAADALLEYATAGSWNAVQHIFNQMRGTDPFADTYFLLAHWAKDHRLNDWQFSDSELENWDMEPQAVEAARLSGAMLNALRNGDFTGARLLWGMPVPSRDEDGFALIIERSHREISQAVGMGLLLVAREIGQNTAS